MPKKHLTSQFIKNLTPDPQNPTRIEYYDQHLIKNNTLKSTDVKGLFIRLTKAGSIFFYYRYWFNQKPRSYKIGDYPNIGLSDARNKARELASKVNNGKDPQAKKKKKQYKPKK